VDGLRGRQEGPLGPRGSAEEVFMTKAACRFWCGQGLAARRQL
jgi:hypothetical protein